MSRNAALFLGQDDSMDFNAVLDRVQQYLSENYKELVNTGGQDSKPMMISHIRQYLTDNRLSVSGMSIEQLVSRLYTEMAEFSFLTPYLNYTSAEYANSSFDYIRNVEGIEICSWDNVKVKYADGHEEPAKGGFSSAEHARNVLTRLLHQSNITMDNTKPLVRGHLNKNIRITVNGGGGTLDDEVGIAASIRFINPNHLTREDLIRFGTITPEMMDFLCAAYRYGLSMMLAGETDAGKTTLISIIMSIAVEHSKKLYTIENETREFNLIVRNSLGQILNKVVHTVTRESDDPNQRITQQMLLELAMTMNPDYICMAEVKGSEAFETIEAGLTGHSVIGTTHTFSCKEIPDRFVQLASLRNSNVSDKTLYEMFAKAFPILFYSENMADKVRRVTEICECQVENGRPKVITLWEYQTDYNEVVDGKIIVHGEFVKRNAISEELQRRLRKKGISEPLLQSFIKED